MTSIWSKPKFFSIGTEFFFHCLSIRKPKWLISVFSAVEVDVFYVIHYIDMLFSYTDVCQSTLCSQCMNYTLPYSSLFRSCMADNEVVGFVRWGPRFDPQFTVHQTAKY